VWPTKRPPSGQVLGTEDAGDQTSLELLKGTETKGLLEGLATKQRSDAKRQRMGSVTPKTRTDNWLVVSTYPSEKYEFVS